MRPDLADVYDEHVWDVYAFLAYRLGSSADAEDLTQATFERAARAWHRFDPDRASPRTWLMAIANNLLIDHFRSGRKRQHVPLTADDSIPIEARLHAPGPEEGLRDLSPALATALATLGERERQVIALRFGGDLTGAEIAALLELSVDNVHQILSRSLRRLRSQLTPPKPR